MSAQYEKYIICPSCHIGGYDFCEKCLGAGGYTIQVFEDPSIEKKFINLDKLKLINDRLDLIVQRGIWNNKIEEKLTEYFISLSESVYSTEVLKVLKRILKIRKNNYGKKLLKLYHERTKALEAVKLIFAINETIIHSDKKYFSLWEDGCVVYKLTSSQFVLFSSELLRGFIKNLEHNCLMKFENNDAIGKYKKEEVEAITQTDCLYFDVTNGDSIKKFVIKKSKIRRVCISYINMLQEKNIAGWYYIQ